MHYYILNNLLRINDMNKETANKSFNQEKIQFVNRSLVLSLIRENKVCSRATLAQLSGLKQTTITNIINELISCNLVVETGLMTGNKGRRSIGLKLNDQYYKVIGIRMTRKSFDITLMGLSGLIFYKNRFKISRDETVQITVSRIRTAIQTVRQDNPDSEILAIGMAMPGPYREILPSFQFCYK
jgi:DNA-binding MarR family transcriptional regulator